MIIMFSGFVHMMATISYQIEIEVYIFLMSCMVETATNRVVKQRRQQMWNMGVSFREASSAEADTEER